ncbi:winged helix-turn-helix transcriptional regulator [Aurantimonas sp. A3-2-R12]|uniref:winged helix-turn-helix transcriptional regulator n=1 Tax=Aurantimonas sp. A3-2-R12 TaxID=3114362 RepID=UPI002E187BE7|nr:helix-turn-helix domain-containing protein [Aurantimonas sp. A3-2-R12]
MAKSKTNKRQSGCPIAFSLDAIGDKWSLLIVRDMVFKGRRFYGEFLEAQENISTNILADRLKSLEEKNIIRKVSDPSTKGRYRYELTETGIELIPTLLEVILWGARNDPNTTTPRKLLERLESDKQKYLMEVLEAVEANQAAPFYFSNI